ncbi:MAG TPA: phosphopantetheine-binding protein [Acidimicrobiales bacterium]
MTAATAHEILAKLQKAYDVVKANNPRTLRPDDRLVDDLHLDSLDLIDVVSVLEEEFSPEVVDAVIDASADIETVGQLIDGFVAAASAPTG